MKFPFVLRHDAAIDVVGFGTNAVDFLIQVPAYPDFNSKVELSAYTQAPGGEVATTMAGLQRLGLSTRYAGRFGADDAGQVGIKSLADEGVDLRFAEVIQGARTQIAFIVIDDRNGERTVIWKRDDKLCYTSAEAPIVAVADAKVLHLTPHDTQACIRLAREARERGVIVSIDIDRIFDGVEELLPLVDILIASADLPGTLTGIRDHEAALAEMRSRFGCAVAGITLGNSGSLTLGPAGFIRTPAYPVPGGCKDTTGAGDAYRVGFIYGLVSGLSIEESCRTANAVAALKCRRIGARTSLPTTDEVIQLIKNHRHSV
ncbi:MAG: carbohydrate kinase family protein [Pyrinomonadaceae bacterium]